MEFVLANFFATGLHALCGDGFIYRISWPDHLDRIHGVKDFVRYKCYSSYIDPISDISELVVHPRLLKAPISP